MPRVLSLLPFFFFGNSLFAQPMISPRFGMELTFSNEQIIDDSEKADANYGSYEITDVHQKKWLRLLDKRCKARSKRAPRACTVDGEKVRYTNGFWFAVNTDPIVLEVQAEPLTIERARNLETLIQEEIFDTAASLDLVPQEIYGNGHMHFDLDEAFSGNAEAFRDFFVDFTNHQMLGLGAMGVIPNNGPMLSLLAPASKRALSQLINSFDAAPAAFTINTLAQEILDKVYTSHPWSGPYSRYPAKYQAINLGRVFSASGARTLEVRCLRPQRSADDWIKMAEVFRARLNYLAKQRAEGKGPVALKYRKAVYDHQDPWCIQEPQRVVNEFHEYVTAAGLDWHSYKSILPEYLQELKPKSGRKRIRDEEHCTP